MVEDPLIEQVMVVGANRKFAGALIVPAFHLLKEWCKHNGIEAKNNEDMIANPAVKQRIKETIDEINKNFSQVEQIKRFELLPYLWTIEGGELTPTLKLRRKVIMEKYHMAVERIYQ